MLELHLQSFSLFGNYPGKYFLDIVSTLSPSLSGGGVDCTKLADDDFSLADLEDHTGDWQRVGAYRSWVEARIFEETEPGRKINC